MDRIQAEKLIAETFKNRFDKNTFRRFIINLLDGINEDKAFSIGNAQVKEAFRKNILSYQRIGQYTDKNRNITDVLSVHVSKDCSLDRNRTMLRNFVVEYMKQRGREYVLAAFYSDNKPDWRFSYIRLDSKLSQDDKGRFKVIEEFSSAKRLSFLVGENEPNHTAQASLIPLLIKDYPAIAEIQEAFNVERVSKEFFDNYKELFLQLADNLKEIRRNDERINYEFTLKSITEANFCKKLLGQLVFLYFIQKKGWLGVPAGESWGRGDKQFLRHTFERAVREGKNFFNDYLEPLFYNALANGARKEQYFELLDCKIPFLNGGLFEPVCEYDWVNTDIVFENDIFSNTKKNKAGDTGTGILDVFDRYNFTVKEDEPLEKEVAIDPEMLGKVFENLLEVVDRKSKGAFYTPREIVHYMCQESLINYLCSELDAKDNTKDDITSDKLTRQAVENFIHHSDEFTQTEAVAVEKENKNSVYVGKFEKSIKDNADRIDKALENIKICDPAIGSGAFPVGILNEIVRARLSLAESGYLKETKKHSVYEYKRQAIQNSIYGVDIESGAVEIAKLRLWLSLVVDEEDIKNIKPLPNLDYKIVCANSLLGLEGVIIPDNLQTRFNELVDLFFDETNKQKKKMYQKELSNIKDEVFDIAKSLEFEAVFDYQWFFYQVFKNGGFDVVIANPPYIGEKGHKEIFEPVKNKKQILSKFYLGKMDYFYFFFHLALNILKNNGACAFITTDYYITALGGRLLRGDFKQRAILKELINFNELKIFESALGQHNLITILQKGHDENAKCHLVNVNRKGFLDNTFNNIVNGLDEHTLYNDIPQSELYEGEENYIRLLKEDENSELSVILNKIKGNNEVLGNICNVNQGIVTGADCITEKHLQKYNLYLEKGEGIFTLDIHNEKDKVLIDKIKNTNEKSILKPFFKNSDISRYKTNEKSSKKLIYIDKQKDDINKLPITKEHLLKFKTIIDNSSGNAPYLHRPRQQDIFEGEKIVAPQRSKTNTFGYNECEWYASADVYFITEPKTGYKLKYILALLNSKLYYVWLYNKGKRKGESLELYQKPLSEIPIKKADEQTQSKFISVVDKILTVTQTEDYLTNTEKQQTVKEYENKIDIMVYKFYDLTYQEVLTIDKDFSMSEEEYREYKEYNNTKI